MNRIVQICIGIIGIPFLIVALSYVSKTDKKSEICVVPITTVTKTRNGLDEYHVIASTGIEGVAYFDQTIKKGLTAAHVVNNCGRTMSRNIEGTQIFTYKDCYLNGKLVVRILNVGTSDIARFDVSEGSCTYNQNPLFSGLNLVTYISGNLIAVPVTRSGNEINFIPDYGQSGSPVFNNKKIIGILSRKIENGAVVERLEY